MVAGFTPDSVEDKNDLVYLILLLALGLILRLDLLLANNFAIDADEAIVGLMARHIMDGQGVPVFYYGQHYMGSLEPLLIALVSSFTGLSNISVKLVPLFFSLSLIVVIYYLALEVGSRFSARLSALFFTVPPMPLLVWGLKARGGFVELLVIGALALLITCYWLKKDKPSLSLTALTGFLLGLGWWTNYQIIYFMLPIGMFFTVHLVKKMRNLSLTPGKAILHPVTGTATFLAGGAPFWVYNIQHSFVSFEMFGSSPPAAILDNLIGFSTIALPVLFGARSFWEMDESFPGSAILVWLIYLPLFCLYLWARRRQLLHLCTFTNYSENRAALIALFFIVTTSVFVASSYGYLVQAPRYLLPLYIALFIVSAEAITYLRLKNPPVAGCFIVVILAFNLSSVYSEGRAVPPNLVFKTDRVSLEHSDLVDWLEKKNFKFVRTNYWIGNLLAFYSGERVRFIPFQVPYDVRIPAYQSEAQAYDDQDFPLVLVPSQSVLVKRALQVLGESYEEKHFPGYVVLYNRKPRYSDLERYDQASITATASVNPEAAYRIVDSNLETRWGSGTPQRPGMEVVLTLKEPEPLRAFKIHLGRWGHDFPRALKVEAELIDGTIAEVFSRQDYAAILYLKEYRPSYLIPIELNGIRSVKFTQLGVDPVFDWSIAQVELYR